MPYSDIYLYSPLTIKTASEGQNPALLLQFILSELFHAMDAEKKEDPLEFVFSSPACFFPYDWSYEVGCLNKIAEHANLLVHAFPKLVNAASVFREKLEKVLLKVTLKKSKKEELVYEHFMKDLSKLYSLLEPFLIACKESEDLLLFLFKNADEVSEVAEPNTLGSLLAKMFPEGTQEVSTKIRNEYVSRGFHSLLPEIEQIVSCYD